MSRYRRTMLNDIEHLPKGFVSLGSVSCDGTVYFDTGYGVSSSDCIECTVRMNAATTGNIFGAVDADGKGFGLLLGSNRVKCTHGTEVFEGNVAIGIVSRTYIYGDSGLYINGTLRCAPFSSQEFKLNNSLYIGAENADGIAAHLIKGMIYGLNIYGGDGALLHKYVPCKRTADNVDGLFDLLHRRFLDPISI